MFTGDHHLVLRISVVAVIVIYDAKYDVLVVGMAKSNLEQSL